MIDKSTISGFILAGGLSTRMGSDKALLKIAGEPLLGRMINIIRPFCHRVAVSGMKEDYQVFSTEMIADLVAGIGPISGIYSSLKISNSEWNLLVSVDVPFLNKELLDLLILNKDGFDCVIPKHDSGLEPLVGLYHKNALPVVDEMIKNGDYKLMNLLSKLNTRYLDCNFLIKKYPRLFMNLNRPEDFNSI